MVNKDTVFRERSSIKHNYYEITNTLLDISDSSILTTNYISLHNPQHKSITEIIDYDNICLIEDSVILPKNSNEEKTITLNDYIYYLSFIANWNKIDQIIQMHKFYNNDLSSICYAFSMVFFDFDKNICESEFINICTAIEIFGNESFSADSYYYNWFNDNFVKGEDMFTIGLLKNHNIIWN